MAGKFHIFTDSVAYLYFLTDQERKVLQLPLVRSNLDVTFSSPLKKYGIYFLRYLGGYFFSGLAISPFVIASVVAISRTVDYHVIFYQSPESKV